MRIIRQLSLLIIALTLALAPDAYAQKRKTTAKKKANTTAVAKKKKTTTKKTTKKKTTKKTGTSIDGLKNQSAQIKRNIKEQERKLKTNERDVKQRLQNLMVINSEIADKRKTIDTIRRDISTLDGNIGQLNNQLKKLNEELEDRKQKYLKSIRYMHRNNSIQNQLMFIFSAKNFSQMYRRLRFTREYANYQRAQGEAVKAKQADVAAKHKELTVAKTKKHSLLNKGEQERRNLEGKQTEQQNVVNSLQRQQKTIQGIIAQQRKKDEAINAQIDRLVAIEVEKARQRAIAEAKRKAEQRKAEAEAKRRQAEELARKKAAAEAAARENARRVAEARQREERLKAEAREAARRKDAEERKAAENAARQAERERQEAERKARQEAQRHERELAEAKREAAKPATPTMDTEDRRISGSFEQNRGRLPMPVTGQYRIVSHFGQYNVEGLTNVRLDNKGINIQGQPGAQARSIFDGEVSAVFSLGGTTGVMVRHGSYISVYCNLQSVSVARGQHVSARQSLGTLGQDNILQFQLRREKDKLNPEAWLRR